MEILKKTLKSMVARLNNTGSVLALVGMVVALLLQFGIKIDTEWVTQTVTIVCSILVFFGVLNDPTQSKDAYIPYVQDKLIDKE